MNPSTSEPDLFSRVHSKASQQREPDPSFAPKTLILQRQSHAAWQLLAAHRAPLILACLKPLFDSGVGQIPLDDAREQLTRILAAYANDPDFEINDKDFATFARKELREWIQKGLLAERGGDLFATDSLQTAFRFIEGIQERMMTSTASRLSTVQQKIESLEAALNPDKTRRIQHLEAKIAALQKELKATREGQFEVLEGERAAEEIREVYALSMSLRADFRRVEDSYREADRNLRQSIVSENQNRGAVLDSLLETNATLLNTSEGRVFKGFYEQVIRSDELDRMRTHIRAILSASAASDALTQAQVNELRGLISRLIDESQHVMQARTRSEKDVRGFIKTGLAGEHHRVGDLLNNILETALQIDWSRQAVRRIPGTLPPIAPALPNLPAPERLEYKSLEEAETTRLNLEQQEGSLDILADSYLENYDELDRQELFANTLHYLQQDDRPHSLAELAQALPPIYDLETLSYWITLAREADLHFDAASEQVDLADQSGENIITRFHLPSVHLDAAALASITPETLE